MQIEIKESAKKDLRKIDRSKIEKIFAKIQSLTTYPDTPNVKKLQNFSPTHRLRFGDYRILFDIKGNKVVVGRIKHRKEAY